MQLHEEYGLTKVVNACGSFTPLCVLRSSPSVAISVASALQKVFVIDELQKLASRRVSEMTGAEAATAVHCASAAITLAIAGAMTGTDVEKFAAMPDARRLPRRVVIPASHAVNFGHPIVQDARLAGAEPILFGSEGLFCLDALASALDQPETACLMLVSSRLVKCGSVDMAAAVALAHRCRVPAIIDGAAQDLRIPALLASGADAAIVSAQKYLAAPTAGIVIGRASFIAAVRA